MSRIFFLFFICFTSLSTAERPEHVVIVSFDGGNPTLMQKAKMPNFQRIVAGGAHTFQARTILPSKTLPSHTSMLTGLDISKHGVDWNDYLPIRGPVRVPTVFELLKADSPESVTSLFCGKIKFRHLWKAQTLNVFNCGSDYDDSPIPASEEKKLVPAQQVVAEAVKHITEKRPKLCFIHFPDADSAGHKHGWGSAEQMAAFEVCDQALGQVIKALETAQIMAKTTLILSADHGGKEKNHFNPIPDDIFIPWVAYGVGAKKGYTIHHPTVMTYDTTATALWLLGVNCPETLDGQPVLEAFE